MRKLFRDPAIRRDGIAFLLVSLAAIGIALWSGATAALFTAMVCLLLDGLWLHSTYRSNCQLAQLSEQIDAVLHGSEQLDMQEYQEGELSILQSELHKMTVRLREQRDQLEQDKTDLADALADISHQIRTPLTSINLLVSMLSRPNLPESQRRQLLRELSVLLDRIDRLITVLLKISRLDAGMIQFEPEHLELDSLIRRAAEPLLVPLELREQTLTIQAEGQLFGDPMWCGEAIANVLKNCMEHTPQGGHIAIAGTENPLYTQIEIQDSGPGISQKDLPHLFERFYKGENSVEGSFGIGLALARTIVTRQQGTIQAQNGPNGAVFTLRFYKGTV